MAQILISQAAKAIIKLRSLSRILINRCKRILAVKNRKKTYPIDENAFYNNTISADDIALWEAVKKLEYKDRIIVSLRYLELMEINEIAYTMKERVGTVKSRLHRVLPKLKKILEGE